MKHALALILATSLTSHAADGNWPQWRGPTGNGTAAGDAPPAKWSETENIKWKVKIPGTGSATPIIWGDKVFVLTAIPGAKKEDAPAATPQPPPGREGDRPRRGRGGFGGFGGGGAPTTAYQFTVIALDRATGRTLWQKTASEHIPHEGHHRDGTYASASPVTDGEHLYASFGSHGIYCYDLAGNLQWKTDLGDMRTRNSFGEGASPALHGDTLIVNWDHEGEDFIVALDKKTGRERWRKQRDEPTSWSTPLILEHGGKTHVIVSATNRIRSYDITNGDTLWEASGMTTNAIPSPVHQDGTVFLMSGFRGNALLAIKLGATGSLDGTDAIAWKHGKNTPYVPSPLLTGGRLYFFSGNTNLLSCLDAKTGRPYYEAQRIEGLPGGVYASPAAAGGHIYLTGRDGSTVTIKAGETLEVLATSKLDDRIDASPAIAGGQLFLRGSGHLYCIAEK